MASSVTPLIHPEAIVRVPAIVLRLVIQKFDRLQESRIARAIAVVQGHNEETIEKMDMQISHDMTMLENATDMLRPYAEQRGVVARPDPAGCEAAGNSTPIKP